eukprot:255443_1
MSTAYFGTSVTVPKAKLYSNDSIYNIPYTLQNNMNNPYATSMFGKYHLMAPSVSGECEELMSKPNETLYEICTEIVKQSGFDFVDAYYHGNIIPNPYYSHNPEWMVERAQHFIYESIHTYKKPFFMYFSPTLTHDPDIYDALFNYSITSTPKGHLTGSNIPNNTGMDTRDNIWNKALNTGYNTWTRLKIAAGTIWIDESLGAIIKYLKHNKIYNNTFIVYVSDHGTGAKGMIYEQGTRIIQYIRYPPLFGTSGHILSDDFIVSTVDLASVIFELANINITTDLSMNYILDSKSWLNDVITHINENKTNISQPNCCEYRYQDIYNSHAVVNKDFKYIFRATSQIESDGSYSTFYKYVNDEEQLYALNIDPNEQNNQINNVSLSGVINQFRKQMTDYIQDAACPVDDTENCIIPNVTPSPTVSGMTCNHVIYWDTSWKGVTQFNITSNLSNYLQQGKELLVTDYSNECGNDTTGLEYAYNITYIQRRLDLQVIVCCCCCNSKEIQCTFGNNWVIPDGFISNWDAQSSTISSLSQKPSILPTSVAAQQITKSPTSSPTSSAKILHFNVYIFMLLHYCVVMCLL